MQGHVGHRYKTLKFCTGPGPLSPRHGGEGRPLFRKTGIPLHDHFKTVRLGTREDDAPDALQAIPGAKDCQDVCQRGSSMVATCLMCIQKMEH